MAKTVRQNFEAGNIQMPDDALREQLSRECRVFEKLSSIQEEVTKQFGCRPGDVQELQRRHGKAAWRVCLVWWMTM